ncbi:putative dimethyl sulfoxide reductase chain YnfE [bioreactor metagenome]|uniref:Putative dimethyl sulfoxide reductase chain YnfE n=1 Tax=bioreactor metagenome TaxID=1076179 RepID=A0A644TCF2_9ZZZZ|nr:molybdopterin-dependent oxidoreductase [Negativicutes bacterium]
MQISRSVCPYDCPDTCGLLIHSEDNKVIKVKGDPDHPFTRGTLCPKMAHYEKTIHSPRRILTPLIRRGPKGSGDFYPVSWNDAIKLITQKWQDIIAKCGAEAIVPCSYAGTMGLAQRNCGQAFFYRLGASQLDRTICSPAKGYGWKAVMGSTPGPNPNEIQRSDLIILWGINALATNIHITHDIDIAKQRGAKVWVIDTYETTAAKLADKVFITRPGSDGALALGIMHVLAGKNLVDGDFIKQYVQGYDELVKEVLPHYSPESVSTITGLDPDVIREMASLYARANASFIRLGSGLSRYGNGAMTVRTITCLPALVGAWSRPGGGILCSTSSNAFDVSLVTRDDFKKSNTRVVNINKLGDALNELDDPPIMSFYVYHSNPANVLPDQNKVLKGLAREDLFTVVHERFMTDTAQYADVILPATTSVEHGDLYSSYGNYTVQRAYPVIAPVGEAKANWEVFSLLAAGMGFDDDYFHQSVDEMIDKMIERNKGLTGSQLESLKASNPVEVMLPDNYKMTFKTISGKIEILNPSEADPLPRYLEPYGDQAPFWFINSPTPYLLNSSFNERDDLTSRTKVFLMMNPADAAAKNLQDGQEVAAFNERGEVAFYLKITNKVPAGVVVTEGVLWNESYPGKKRSVNALTSQRLTDKANGSTFYDVKVDVKGLEQNGR